MIAEAMMIGGGALIGASAVALHAYCETNRARRWWKYNADLCREAQADCAEWRSKWGKAMRSLQIAQEANKEIRTELLRLQFEQNVRRAA